jgi:hypothetical protein
MVLSDASINQGVSLLPGTLWLRKCDDSRVGDWRACPSLRSVLEVHVPTQDEVTMSRPGR